jgi:hypothetical protein
MDEYWKEMPFVKRMLNTDSEFYLPTTPLGAPYVTVPLPRRPFLLFLMTLLDSFRLSRALIGEKDVSLTLIVLFEELLTGQWRQMILTAAGLLSPSGVAMGVIGKYIVNTWSLIDGNVRTDIVKTFFKGGKSLFIGFMLWCITTLPPQSYKDSYKKKIDEFKDLQQKAQNPAFVCTPAVGEIIKSIEDDPFFRLLMEMLNVPVVKEDRLKACKNVPSFDLPMDPADLMGTIGETKAAAAGLQQQAQQTAASVQQQAQQAVSGVQGQVQGAVTGLQQQAQGAVTGLQQQAQAALQQQTQGVAAGLQAVSSVAQTAQKIGTMVGGATGVGGATSVGGATGVGGKRKTRKSRRNHST